ncbi:carboxypeptidase-like regulatory domain-containing protein [Halalkalibaculum sp. DA3122]|uniref:TonB-dependent receptor n=1 Tax=Halalkalibaculum sp. DA3122 TaxID=3373607 RepID=UPI0037544543
MSDKLILRQAPLFPGISLFSIRFEPAKNIVVRILLAVVFFMLALGSATAQTASVRGLINDAQSGQPLEGANVVLQLTDTRQVKGRATDANGFYQISNITPGNYVLRISYVGYMPYQDTLTIKRDQNLTFSISLRPDSERLDELVVASGGAARLEGGRQKVSATDLSRVPTPAGGGDLASYLQTLPGVVTAGDRGGQLHIRGGTPSQNMVLVDGTMIYQPFHILGFFSTFPEELVASADFYAGGFGPRYTSRISSVLDIAMKDGNRNEAEGTASASPFLGEVVVEGPLSEGKSSWIGSVRRSLIEQTSPWWPGGSQPLHFESQYLKTSFFGNNNSRCSVTGVRTYDRGRLDEQENDVIRWKNLVAGGRCVALPEGSDLLFDINAGLSYVSSAAGGSENPERTSRATRVNLDVNLSRYFDQIRVDYGMFFRTTTFNYEMSELFGGPQSDFNHLASSGAYAKATIPVGSRVMIQPGSAVTIYRNSFPVSIEPRLRLSWQPRGLERETLHLAGGIYRQPVTGISDKRDAGSVFKTWMPVPTGGAEMEAWHGLLGWQQSVRTGLEWSIESYYKRLQNLSVPTRNSTTRFTTDLVPAEGYVLGGDIRLEYQSGLFYGLLGYGYSWTEYETRAGNVSDWAGDSDRRFHPPHDQRHQVNFLASLEHGGYTVGLRWQLGTGFPFIQPQGFFEALPFSEHLPITRQDPGTQRVITQRGRLPVTHRMDISAERSLALSSGRLNIQVGAINLYDQENLFYYDVYNNRGVDQLSFTPYFSIKYEPGSLDF